MNFFQKWANKYDVDKIIQKQAENLVKCCCGSREDKVSNMIEIKSPRGELTDNHNRLF